MWIVGTYTDEISSTFFPTETYSLHWNGTSWVTVPSADAATGPSVLTGVASTPGAAIIQAVGFSGSSGAENPLPSRAPEPGQPAAVSYICSLHM